MHSKLCYCPELPFLLYKPAHAHMLLCVSCNNHTIHFQRLHDRCLTAQVLLLVAVNVPELKVEIHGALQVGILAVATGGSVQVNV